MQTTDRKLNSLDTLFMEHVGRCVRSCTLGVAHSAGTPRRNHSLQFYLVISIALLLKLHLTKTKTLTPAGNGFSEIESDGRSYSALTMDRIISWCKSGGL